MKKIKLPDGIIARIRIFRIWQKTGRMPFHIKKAREKVRAKAPKHKDNETEFFRGAFDSIPFLNDDAKRTFVHLLLRPGYMIRDYLRGAHEIYLAPLTALIIFYAFFTLICSVVFPGYQSQPKSFSFIPEDVHVEADSDNGRDVLMKMSNFITEVYVLTQLDLYPDSVDTPWKSSLAAVESNLRSQGVYEFITPFFFMWLAIWIGLRRKYHMTFSASAATSAFIICQFSFFMIFAILISGGQKHKIGTLLMGILIMIDYRQLLDVKWKKSIRLTIRTGLWMLMLYILFWTTLLVGILLYFK